MNPSPAAWPRQLSTTPQGWKWPAAHRGAIAGSQWPTSQRLYQTAGTNPSLDLEFARTHTLNDSVTGRNLISFTRASSGTFVGSDGLIQTATTNEPRFDHNPTTGESLGLLVEEARTNSIRNNTMVGAVAGTPGTLPTNWTGATTVDGLTREIIRTGTQNGISYIDVRFSGTSGTGGSTVLVTFDSLTQAIALTGQTWTPSIYLSIVNGSATNISTLTIRHRYYNAVGTALTSSDTSILTSLSSVLQRFNGTAFTATDALTAYTMFLLNVDFVNSSPVDITLRIGLPQLEQGAFATSVIPTTTATVTRAADVASITGSNFSSWYNQTEGTMFADALNTAVIGTTRIFSVSGNSNANRIHINRGSVSGGNIGVVVTTSSAAQVGLTLATSLAALTSNKSAFAYKTNDFAGSVNGLTPVTQNTGSIPTVSQATMGNGDTLGGNTMTGTIKRITYWPTRLANTTLQQITQP